MSGDVVADSVATYSDGPDAFAASLRPRSVALSQASRRFFSPLRPCSMLVVAQDETSRSPRRARPQGVGVDLNRDPSGLPAISLEQSRWPD